MGDEPSMIEQTRTSPGRLVSSLALRNTSQELFHFLRAIRNYAFLLPPPIPPIPRPFATHDLRQSPKFSIALQFNPSTYLPRYLLAHISTPQDHRKSANYAVISRAGSLPLCSVPCPVQSLGELYWLCRKIYISTPHYCSTSQCSQDVYTDREIFGGARRDGDDGGQYVYLV